MQYLIIVIYDSVMLDYLFSVAAKEISEFHNIRPCLAG